MSETPTTPYSNKVEVLADIWMSDRNLEMLEELFTYGDLGFPLAYAIQAKIITSSPLAEEYINELWDLLLNAFEVEDNGLIESRELLYQMSPVLDWGIGDV